LLMIGLLAMGFRKIFHTHCFTFSRNPINN